MFRVSYRALCNESARMWYWWIFTAHTRAQARTQIKFLKIRLQKLWCPVLILTALLVCHTCSRWYTQYLHVVTTHLSYHYTKAYIEAQKKSVSSGCWQEETACFTLVSDTNRFPARRFLRLLWDGIHWAPYCQPDWWLVMGHSQQFRSFVGLRHFKWQNTSIRV